MTQALRYFTTSWDDGHPLDQRVAEILARHGFGGTFYVPRNNTEGRPVLSSQELRSLARRFEIGSHTRDHVRLDALPEREIREQILDGKRHAEDELGMPVMGFCYPGGVHNAEIRRCVKAAGFRYARTIANFCTAEAGDPFRIPTTLQLYPHARVTYVKNYIRCGAWAARRQAFSLSLRGHDFERTLRDVLRLAASQGGIFHLWGHSWEIEQNNLWDVLDDFLRSAADLASPAKRVDNATAYALR